jgi:hypothetical protein
MMERNTRRQQRCMEIQKLRKNKKERQEGSNVLWNPSRKQSKFRDKYYGTQEERKSTDRNLNRKAA